MSYMKNKVLDIIEMLGEGYSIDDVTSFTGIPYADIMNVASEYGVEIKDEDGYDGDYTMDMIENYDGEALASAGFGTDEDYGYYGD